MVVACVAITDCITSLPSVLSTATEMVLWWTSRPIYLMLSIGCSFREVWLLLQHHNHTLLRKGRPFIMRAPPFRLRLAKAGSKSPMGCRSATLLEGKLCRRYGTPTSKSYLPRRPISLLRSEVAGNINDQLR